MMLKKLKLKYLDFAVKRLSNKEQRAKDKRTRLAKERYRLRYSFGTDVTDSDFNPKKGGGDALDSVNSDYVEVVPTYYGEDGRPKGEGPFVSN